MEVRRMKTKITIPDTDITIHPLGLGTVNAGLGMG